MTVHSPQPTIIDLRFLGQQGVIASFLLGTPEEAALIEVGPASTAETLLVALADAGISPLAVRQLLVTHIHLDHAGAAGLLLERFPHATLYAHERGVPHLIDPSKLVASATRIYGADMDRLWGPVRPVAADRVIALRDGDLLDIAGHPFAVLYTPGHAGHHVAFHSLGDGSVYTGDAAGIRMEGCTTVRPPTPPPELDLEAWEHTLDRLAALGAPVFYATHYGRNEDTSLHLERLRSRLRDWERLILHGLRAGQDRAAIADLLRRAGDAEILGEADQEMVKRYEFASAYLMNVAGYERYLRKRHDLPPAENNG